MRDSVDHDMMGAELTGRIRALGCVLEQRLPCPDCEVGVLSPLYEAGSEELVEHVCERCGYKE